LNSEEQKEIRSVYLNLTYKVIEIAMSNKEQFDKSILTLSSAALGLIFSFLRELLVKNQNLKTAVVVFVGAIILTVLNFQFSNTEIKKIIQLFDQNFKNLAEGKPLVTPKKSNLVKYCTYVVACLFVAGVCLVTCAVLNP
jgi:uncharacterized protein YacL